MVNYGTLTLPTCKQTGIMTNSAANEWHTGTGETWYSWTTGSSTTNVQECNVISNGVWTIWVYGSSDPIYIQGPLEVEPSKEVTEQLVEQARQLAEERERARIQKEREAEERRMQEQQAKERAKEFLLELLDAQQKKDFLEKDMFMVMDKLGRWWRIENKFSGNLVLLGKDQISFRRMCVVFKESGIPIYDLMAFQKLSLETNPEEIERIANIR